MENQAVLDGTMPVRILSYDAASYVQQVKNGERLRPVVTIVLNFSDQKWDVAESLGGMFHVTEELKPYFQDYRIHVFDIAFLSDEVVRQFTSTFKHVAHFFVNRKRSDYHPLDEEIEHLPEFLDLLRVFSGDMRYGEILPEVLAIQKKEGAVTMDTVLDAAISKGLAKGREEGREEGRAAAEAMLILKMHRRGNTSEQIAEIMEKSIEEVEAVIRKGEPALV